MVVLGFFSSDSDDTSDSPPPKDPKTTIISDGAAIEGLFELGSVNLRIEGRVKGDIYTEGRVVVAEGAEVEGTINAVSVLLGGYTEGDVHAEEEIVLSPSAEVHALLEAEVLEIQAGADFRGSVAGEKSGSETADSRGSDLDSLSFVRVSKSSRGGDGEVEPRNGEVQPE